MHGATTALNFEIAALFSSDLNFEITLKLYLKLEPHLSWCNIKTTLLPQLDQGKKIDQYFSERMSTAKH